MIEWRIIPGWPQYEVSAVGGIRRVVRSTGFGGGGFVGERKPYLASNGYLYIVLRQSGQPKRALAVHRLVALAFLPDPEPGQDQVAHSDGNRLNNAVGNLRWATRVENEADKIAHGKSNRGASNGRAKIGPDDVGSIVAAISSGEARSDVAARFGISERTISDIMTGKSWGHLTGFSRRERADALAILDLTLARGAMAAKLFQRQAA
jgi:hypothetical protein